MPDPMKSERHTSEAKAVYYISEKKGIHAYRKAMGAFFCAAGREKTVRKDFNVKKFSQLSPCLLIQTRQVVL